MRTDTFAVVPRGSLLYSPRTAGTVVEHRINTYVSRQFPARPLTIPAPLVRFQRDRNDSVQRADITLVNVEQDISLTAIDEVRVNDAVSEISKTSGSISWLKRRSDQKSVSKTNTTKQRVKKPAPLIGLISSKNPVAALEVTVQSLFAGGADRVIIVDDGSDDPESMVVFDNVEAAGAEVLHLKKNVGKSKALKRAFAMMPKRCIIVQTDDDTLATDLRKPAELIRSGKADVVDIRVETIGTKSLLGLVQELDYWLINAVTKRVQDVLRARLWMSGASVMYSYEAGKDILKPAHTITEDTEGLFRARAKGWKIRFYSKHDGQFLTMVPEDFSSLHKQWRRWAMGGGQIIGIYGMGGGNLRVAAVNVFAWFNLIAMPFIVVWQYGLVASALAGYGWGITVGLVGAIRLKRARLLFAGIFLPYISALWAFHALQGLYLAYRHARSGKANVMTWVSPKRTAVIESLPITTA